MADIFISYSRADRDKVAKLAHALEAQGYSVWWDRQLLGGDEFSADIERELEAAGAVIVCWSDDGSKSKWVKDEASIAADAGKMIAVSLDGADPPIGYRQYHVLGLKQWNGGAEDGAFIDVARAAEARIKGEAPPAAAYDRDGAPRNPGKVLAVAGLVAIAAAAGWFFLTQMKPGPDAARSEQAASVAVSEKSIAVLPFAALSEDDSDAYFGKGVAEELLNALAQFPELKVAARTSAFSYQDKDVDIREIANALGVAHVLEGSVRRSGDTLRVTAQLIRADDGFHLWSNTYEKPATDIFAIEDEIVRDIARTLEVRLGVGGGAGRASAKGVDPRAYDEFLRGLTYWGDRDRAANNRPDALKSFQNAAGFDPDFADAWAAIGFAGVYSFPFQLRMARDDYTAMIEEAFDKALALDSDNAIAHAGLLMWRLGEPDIGAAKMHMERALALSPNRADAHYVAAHYWALTGDVDQATAAFERALTLDPLNMMMRRVYASFLSAIGRFDAAFAFNDQCLETQCLAEGFPAHGLFQAMYSGDAARIEKWLPVYERLEAQFAQTPPERKPPPLIVMPAAVSLVVGRPDAEEQLAEARAWLSGDVVREEVGMWGPFLVRALPPDVILDSIESALDTRNFVGSMQNISPLYGANPWPDEILTHPRYRALWARPGMAELAAARRANGWEDGLPPLREPAGDVEPAIDGD